MTMQAYRRFRVLALSLTALAGGLLAWTAGASAQDDARAKIRWDYRHKEGAGYFQNAKEKEWIEVFEGKVIFTFKESARNNDFIELYDASRPVWVRIYENKSLWKHPELTNGEYRPLWEGAWSRPKKEGGALPSDAPPVFVWRLEINLGEGLTYFELTPQGDGSFKVVEYGAGNVRGTAHLKGKELSIVAKTGDLQVDYRFELNGPIGEGTIWWTENGSKRVVHEKAFFRLIGKIEPGASK
jgi:hypothetical protein